MEVTFRFDGVVGHAPPPGFEAVIQPDGFTVTVPVGYTILINPMNPPEVQIQEGVNNEHVNLTEQIRLASEQRMLSQTEIIYLLQNDSLPIRDHFEIRPATGIFMYQMGILSHRDGHNYNRSHLRFDIPLGDEGIMVKYRWSYVVHPTEDLALAITARRYYFADGDKFLVHYLQGGEHVNDDNETWIPVNPVLAQ